MNHHRPSGPVRQRACKIEAVVSGVRWFAWFTPHLGVGWWYPACPPDRDLADWCDLYDREVFGMELPKVGLKLAEGELLPVDMPACLKGLPRLSEFLGSPIWDGGEQKGERALMLFADNSNVRIVVKVQNPGLLFSQAGRTIDDAFASVEAVLKSGQVPWTVDKRAVPLVKPKGKKGA